MTKVAVIGLGAMGLPMAQKLTETYDVSVFDLNPVPVAEVVALGAQAANTIAEVVTDADVTVIVVRNGEQLRTVLFSDTGALPHLKAGSSVIVTSTVGEDALIECETKLAHVGVSCIDAALSGGPVRARTGELLLMVGGPLEENPVATEVLEALSTTMCVVGPRPGQGQQLKAVNQLLCGIHTAAANEALALAHELGLDLDVTLDVLSTGAAASFMFADRGPRIVQQLRGETPPLRSRLDVIGKDMGIVGDITRARKLATPVASAAESLYRLAEAAGVGAQDDSIVATLLSTTRPTDANPHNQIDRREALTPAGATP